VATPWFLLTRGNLDNIDSIERGTIFLSSVERRKPGKRLSEERVSTRRPFENGTFSCQIWEVK